MGILSYCVKFLFFLSSAILIDLSVTITAQPKVNNQLFHYCGKIGNYSTTAYRNNLNTLLASLSSNASTSTNGFANINIGHDPDTIYGSFLCRGDINNQSCQACVEKASVSIIQRCPNKKESIIWFDHCTLRYSNESFFTATQTSPVGSLRNPGSSMDPDGLNRVLENLMESLVTEAETSSSSSRVAYFATKEVNLTKSRTIYGLVQCNPDISRGSCNSCLRTAIGRIPICCDRRLGGRVAFPSCNLRYELYPFYESRADVAAAPAMPPSPLFSVKPPVPLINSTHPQGQKENSSRIVVSLVIPLAIVLVVLPCAITVWLCRRRRRTKQKTITTVDDMEDITTIESLQFDFEIVKAATNDFSDGNKLGQGGFGAVYKGELPNGQKIAVKRLSRHSEQGDEEFKNEVVLVAKLQHRNLVRLQGFCFQGEERLLIYEFVPNASLDQFIFDPVKRADLNWDTRYRIIGGIARGMLYLHEDSRHRIIHRDLKASNILLDAEMNPKISDFGMARLFVAGQSQGNTRRIAGTRGYMSPEYAIHGHFSVKSDVFSFGVLLLEIVIGQKNSSFYRSEQGEDLLSHAWRRWREGTALDLIDPALQNSFSAAEANRCIHISLLCVQEDASERPTMGSVFVMLTSHSVSLALPSKPAYYISNRTESGLIVEVDESHSIEPEQALARSRQISVNDLPITEVHPR